MSEILRLVSEAKEKTNNLFESILELNNKYSDNLGEGPISDSFKKLEVLYKQTEEKLTNPRFTISTLGTTSAGKSTFVNGLLGLMLAPMDADELSAGTLNIIPNDKIKNECKLTIGSDKPQIKSHNDAYKTVYEIMDNYTKNKEDKDLSIPQITFETSFYINQNPSLLGLDNNAKIHIVDLPGLRNISDAYNLRVIQENVKSSFIVVLINYENLYNKETVEKLYDELKEIKNSVGSTATMLFVLSKVDRRNQKDNPIETVIDIHKQKIKQKLNLDNDPDIIPFNSYLFFNIQRAKFAYDNAILLNNNSDNFSEDFLNKNSNIDIIKDSIKIIFEDQSNAITKIKRINKNLIRDIEDLRDENKIPSFEEFYKFYELCFEECGASKLFKSIINRTETSLRELILFPSMNNFIEETSNFINLLNNSIKIAKIKSKNEIDDARKALSKLSLSIKSEIEKQKTSRKKTIHTAIKKILESGKNTNNFKEGIKLLELQNMEDTVRDSIFKVQDDTIEPLTESFEKQKEFSDIKKSLINEYRWLVETTNQLKNPYHKIQMSLFNNTDYIKKGKSFEFYINDTKEENKIREISNELDILSDCVISSMNDHLKLEMQKRINDFTLQINYSINSYKKQVQDNLENKLKEISINIQLPDITSESLDITEYKSDFINRIDSDRLLKEDVVEKKVQSGTEIIKEAYDTTEKYIDIEVYYERVWYKLYLGKARKERKIERERNITKYREKEIPKFEKKDYKIVEFYSVRDMGDSWKESLEDIEMDLWDDIGTYMVSILNMSLSSYEKSIENVMEQVKIVLDKREQEIENEQEFKELVWKEIDKIQSNILTKHSFLKNIVKTKRI